MNSPSNIALSFGEEASLQNGLRSGSIIEDFRPETRPIRAGLRWKGMFGLAIFAVASITTSVPLPPAPFDRRRETSTVLRLYAPTRRRRISLAEARQIALSVLAEAEKRTADFSAQEAKLIAIWEVEE